MTLVLAAVVAATATIAALASLVHGLRHGSLASLFLAAGSAPHRRLDLTGQRYDECRALDCGSRAVVPRRVDRRARRSLRGWIEPGEDLDFDGVLARADAALVSARGAGGNRTVLDRSQSDEPAVDKGA
ncbi:hypothetical protein BH24CHL10_BH24CHL10_07600 [soil metagenome]